MKFRWLRRGLGTGSRAAALLSLSQCFAPPGSSHFAKESETEAGESDDSADSASDEESGSSSQEEASSRPSDESESEADATSSAGVDTNEDDDDDSTTTSTSSSSSQDDDDDDTTSEEATTRPTTMGNTSSSDSADAGDDTTDSGPGDDEGNDDGPVVLDCDAPMPTSGAMNHAGNGVGGDGNLSWEIWSNTGRGELTTYSTPAFSAIWNEAGGYLGRLGYEWGGFGDNPVPHEQVGTITAQFVSRKTGSAGVYSYVGMYGWTTSPCVEWYVVEDSYNNMPINPGSLDAGFGMPEVTIDGGTYRVYKRPTTGTGGTRCSGVTNWDQYYSVRTTARACGEISLTEHFEAWEELGLPMGNLLEAKILVEVGGGSGRVDLPIANVMVD